MADLPVDASVGLIIAMPRLESALAESALAIPSATLLLIRFGHLLAARWWCLLPPIAVTPFLVAWRWREESQRWLQFALIAELLLFGGLCLTILLPIKTILDAN
ncbi:MAG: hypothetical protein ACUVX8_14945 [Candidatus Zipacnadales bacterium]